MNKFITGAFVLLIGFVFSHLVMLGFCSIVEWRNLFGIHISQWDRELRAFYVIVHAGVFVCLSILVVRK